MCAFRRMVGADSEWSDAHRPKSAHMEAKEWKDSAYGSGSNC